jgi:hypothetical protein
MKPNDKDFLLFYIIQAIFIIFIIYFTKLYIEKTNNTYLIYAIVFFIFQFIYSIFAIKHLISKYDMKDVKKSGLPIYLVFNNLLILFITFFMALFIKNKNYLFLILSIIFAFVHFTVNIGMIGYSLELNLDFGKN